MLGLRLPSPAAAAVNLYDATLGGGLADLRRMPAALIDEGPQRRVHRFLPAGDRRAASPPVLLVPPLAAPATCFDLRRGCSLAEHLLRRGQATYVVDYGTVHFGDRSLGLEHWIDDVVPGAVRAVAHDAGGPVQLVGWCLGGILAALAVCADAGLPVASLALVASPFDFRQVPLLAPLRPIDAVTRGQLVTQLYRVLGGAPGPLVQRVYQLAGIDKYVMKPWTILSHADDRELLAQIEAVDAFMGDMTRVSGAELRPALPPVLPHERPRGGPARARPARARPRRRARPGARDRGPGRRDRAGRGLPPRGRPAAAGAVGPARDRAGRAPRRADRARGADDDLAAARRVPRRPPVRGARAPRGRLNAFVQGHRRARARLP